MPVRIPTQVYYNRRSSLPAQPRSQVRDGYIQVESQVFYNQSRNTDPNRSNPGAPVSGRRSSVEPHGGQQRSGSVSSGGTRHRRRSSSSQNPRSQHPPPADLWASSGNQRAGYDMYPTRHQQYSQPNLVYLRRSSYAPPGSHGYTDQLSHEQWLSLQGLRRPQPASNITYVRRASQSNPNPRVIEARGGGVQQGIPPRNPDVANFSSSPGSVVYLRRAQGPGSPVQRIVDGQYPPPPHPPPQHPLTQHPPVQHPPPQHPPVQHPSSSRPFSPPERCRQSDNSRRWSPSPGPSARPQRTREGRGR